MASTHHELLPEDLRGIMGFQGFVMSDWLAMHSPDRFQGQMGEVHGGHSGGEGMDGWLNEC